MLKKIMKAALAASLVFGMSSFAYAADFKVGGSFKEYFGQYNDGTDGYEAHFVNYGEANLNFKGSAGKVSAAVEIQADTDATANDSEVTDVKRTVGYMTPVGKLEIGTVLNLGASVPVTGPAYKTSKVPGATILALLYNYTESDGIQLTVPLEGMGMIQVTAYSRGGTILAGNGSEGVDGFKTQVGANLNFGGILVRAGFTSSKLDDPSVTTDGDDKSTSTLLGASIPLGDAMKVAVGYGSSKITRGGADTERSDMSVLFNMKGLGPGALTFTYDMQTTKDSSKDANMTIVYDVAASKSGGFQFGYSSLTNTPDGGDATTETAIVGGLYAAF